MASSAKLRTDIGINTELLLTTRGKNVPIPSTTLWLYRSVAASVCQQVGHRQDSAFCHIVAHFVATSLLCRASIWPSLVECSFARVTNTHVNVFPIRPMLLVFCRAHVWTDEEAKNSSGMLACDIWAATR